MRGVSDFRRRYRMWSLIISRASISTSLAHNRGYLQERFQFTGIPFVVLLNKKGKQHEDATMEQLLEE